MLTIRKEQLAVLEESMRRSFENRMVSDLRVRFPAICDARGEDEVRASIRRGIERAAGYGVVIEAHAARYIRLTFQYGEDFDAAPWAAEVLKAPGRSGRWKIDNLCARGEEMSQDREHHV